MDWSEYHLKSPETQWRKWAYALFYCLYFQNKTTKYKNLTPVIKMWVSTECFPTMNLFSSINAIWQKYLWGFGPSMSIGKNRDMLWCWNLKIIVPWTALGRWILTKEELNKWHKLSFIKAKTKLQHSFIE